MRDLFFYQTGLTGGNVGILYIEKIFVFDFLFIVDFPFGLMKQNTCTYSNNSMPNDAKQLPVKTNTVSLHNYDYSHNFFIVIHLYVFFKAFKILLRNMFLGVMYIIQIGNRLLLISLSSLSTLKCFSARPKTLSDTQNRN